MRGMAWRLRVGGVGAAALGLLWGAGCAGPRAAWMRDESDRIAEGMTPEPFTESTPGAQGIRLGDDAPPLAEPFEDRAPFGGWKPWLYPGFGRTVIPLGGCWLGPLIDRCDGRLPAGAPIFRSREAWQGTLGESRGTGARHQGTSR